MGEHRWGSLQEKKGETPGQHHELDTEDGCCDRKTATVSEAAIMRTPIFGHLSQEENIKPDGIGAMGADMAYEKKSPVASVGVRFDDSGSKKSLDSLYYPD